MPWVAKRPGVLMFVSSTSMRRFLLHTLTTGLALAACTRVVPGVHAHSTGALVVMALVLGLVNAVVRPVLLLLTLPLTILTLGLFYLVVNGAAFATASALVPGFRVDSLGAAIIAATLVSIVSWFVAWLAAPRADARGV